MRTGESIQALISKAMEARENAYAPYSQFKVGAALMTREGKIYTGCNVENSSYGLTVCAERVAFFKAISEGEREFDSLAIYAGDGGYTSPCGACRQVLFQFGGHIEVYMVKSRQDYKVLKAAELLPAPFNF